MMNNGKYKAINPGQSDNVFNLIGSDWMLITVGTKDNLIP